MPCQIPQTVLNKEALAPLPSIHKECHVVKHTPEKWNAERKSTKKPRLPRLLGLVENQVATVAGPGDLDNNETREATAVAPTLMTAMIAGQSDERDAQNSLLRSPPKLHRALPKTSSSSASNALAEEEQNQNNRIIQQTLKFAAFWCRQVRNL